MNGLALTRKQLCLAVCAALGGMTSAHSQEVSQTTALETITVTGSRIVSTGYEAPTPVTVARADELLLTTPTSIPDGLNKLPQFQLSSSPARSSHNFANTASNGNILNLRGVGGSRSLILFDGVRVAPTTYVGEVDIDVLPSALISNVDVVTAGASAAYGSDAVAGVVNFVLDRDFVGWKGNAQYGVSERGDNENYRVSVAGGMSLFADGAGHLLFSGEFSSHDGMLRSDRSVSLRGYNYVGSVPGGGTPGSPSNPFVLRDNIRLVAATDGGLIVSGVLRNYRFLPDGSLTPFDAGTPTGTPGYNQGGDGYVIPPDVTAVAPLDTTKLFGRFEYEFGNGVTAYVQAIGSKNELTYVSLANSFVGVTPALIRLDNPWLQLTSEQRAQLEAAGETMLSVALYSPYAPKPRTSEETDYFNATLGFEGSFGETWSWKAAYNRGQSDHEMKQAGLFDWRKAYAAIDAVRDANGNIVCRATLSADPVVRERFADCRPLNVLGDGAMLTTPDGYAYAIGTSMYRAKNVQDFVTISASGKLFDLPAGSVDAAFGVEYRKQTLELTSNADPALLDTPAERDEYFYGVTVPAGALFYWLTNVGVADGSVNVKEAFVEFNFPVLRDAPLAQSLDINVAGRATDYSTSGSVETWKIGTTWRPVDDLRFRATVSRDIRAPTLFNLFAGDQSSIGQLVDPVSGQTANVTTLTGGNRNLQPEESDTFSVGVVISPRAIPEFTVALDYYRLKIEDAIGTLGTTQIVQNCHASGGTAPECALITRPAPDAFPTLVRNAPANIAFLETAGFDLDASYRLNVAGGDLAMRLYASYLDTYKTQQHSTAPIYEFAGIGLNGAQPIARPRLRGMLNLNYEIGNFGASLSQQYIGSFKLGSQEPNQNYVDPYFGSVSYTDLTLRYRFERAGTEAFLTVNNLFDRDPPLIPGSTPGVNLPTIISVYDTVGRAFTAGVRVSF
ncbi:MAG TPA: TonB-dependent receptor [Steroidobacteraceae bacterium]